MIESMISGFKCPECSSPVQDTNVDIVWAAWSTLNLDVVCPSCSKHTMVKSEVLSLDLAKLASWKISWKFSLNNKSNELSIRDEHIVDLDKNLKKKSISVNDLFSWDKNDN